MFIASNSDVSTDTRATLQKSQNLLIDLYRTMVNVGITEIEEAGRTIERHEVLKGAELVGKILDVCV
jgi:hypothetical protein